MTTQPNNPSEKEAEKTCTQCQMWDDGGCDFGCPCFDCEVGHRYEAFCTSPLSPMNDWDGARQRREAAKMMKKIRADVAAEGHRNG